MMTGGVGGFSWTLPPDQMLPCGPDGKYFHAFLSPRLHGRKAHRSASQPASQGPGDPYPFELHFSQPARKPLHPSPFSCECLPQSDLGLAGRSFEPEAEC